MLSSWNRFRERFQPFGQMGGSVATIAEIAREANVSKATVSRVVNRHPDVDPRTAQRVGDVIARLGYVPRASAQALARGRARCIGLQVPTLTLPWLLELLRGIADAVESRTYTLTLYTTTRGAESLLNFAAQVSARVVDGLIVVVPHGLEDEVRELNETDIPIICIDDHVWDVPVVLTTQYQGSYDATTHLIQQGRTPIATITGPLRSQGANDRLDGFRDAARDAGIAPRDTLVASSDWTIDGGAAAMRDLLDQCPELHGLFAANDLMAIGAMSAIAAAGRSVPGDIAVVGFDDIPAAAHTTPALTTIRQPLYEMGHAAALHLIDRLEGDAEQPQSITLPTSLVIRASCGAGTTVARPGQFVGSASRSPR